jgi:hypothetical protein
MLAANPDRLARVQRWMQATILTPGPVDDAIAAETAVAEFPVAQAQELVRPSARLTALERLDIYRGMYEARLVGALEVDYPALLSALGPELFAELGELYLTVHPSRSYTLNRLGDHLPAFLGNVEGLAHREFYQDLAQLELYETEVFDEEETGGSAIPIDELESARFHAIAALRVGTFRYPVNRYMARFRNGPKPRRPRPRATTVVIYRQDYQIRHLELEPETIGLFSALRNGLSLAEALEPVGLSAARVERCFARWFSAGLFRTRS